MISTPNSSSLFIQRSTLSLGFVAKLLNLMGKSFRTVFIFVKQARFFFYSSVFLYFSSLPVKIKVSQGRFFLFFIRKPKTKGKKSFISPGQLCFYTLSHHFSGVSILHCKTSECKQIRKRKKNVRSGKNKTNCIIIFPPKIVRILKGSQVADCVHT